MEKRIKGACEMEFINFVNQDKELTDWDYDSKSQYVILANHSQMTTLNLKIKQLIAPKNCHTHRKLPVRFESLDSADFFSYLFFDQEKKESIFIFEKFSLYLTQNLLIFEVEKHGKLHQDFIEELSQIVTKDSTVNSVYLGIIDLSLSRMFESAYEFEEKLTSVENQIITTEMDFKIDEIIKLKNQCFKAKKYMRMLLYVSDDLMLNRNHLLTKHDMLVVQNIDLRINRVYDYLLNLYEMSAHLLEIYDSTINAVTNDTINKLTVFTVFATPITVISGIYGMNFVNMPELRNPNGYFIVLGIMAVIMVVIYFVLKKLKLL